MERFSGEVVPHSLSNRANETYALLAVNSDQFNMLVRKILERIHYLKMLWCVEI